MKPLIPLALVLSLSACAPIRPGAPATQPLTGAQLNLDTHQAIRWPQANWWARYQDPQLDSLIEQALRANPSLDAAAARVRMARAALQGARAVQWPQVNANYHLTRERLTETYIYPPPLGGSYQTDTGLGVQLDFNLDLWGKNRALAQAARQRAAAADAAQQQARTLLVSAVAQAYFQLQDAQAQVSAIGAIVGKLQEALNITRDRYKNGLGIQVDVDQADSAVSSAQVQLSQAHNNVQLLQHQLAALLGKAPEQLPAPQPRAGQALPVGVPEHMPMALLGRRADITAARLQAQAAGAEVSAAKADFLPNIDLSATFGYLSLGMDQLVRGSSENYGAGPVITLPIFHAGALNAQLEGRRAARDEAIAQYNQTVLGAIREVADASASIRSLHEQIRHQEASLKAITSAYDVALDRYKAGLGNFVQVLLAQSEALKQTVQTTDLHARAYILDVQLATALGGGYAEPDAVQDASASQSTSTSNK
ncbi:efflux transporter outer membrane subunit [Castellaniella caeni]|uniref:efflux transporter outer membrane subunit n=1 Tax=Castellaniella caeni TaxID=266123 RepID=UPI00082C94BF|nr:efflux transporter outer membrane subunit [Castellaniella caeni]